MTNFRFQMRKAATIVACLVVTVMFSSCKDRENKKFDLNGTVTISPADNVLTGDELTAAYSGSETVTWQWNKDGTAVSGATAAKYTPTEAGSYTATASAPGFNSKTSAAVEVNAIYLLEEIQRGNIRVVFEYDNQDRMTKRITYANNTMITTFTYNAVGDLVNVKQEDAQIEGNNWNTTFTKDGNKISVIITVVGKNTESKRTIELNAQGLLEKCTYELEDEEDSYWVVYYTWQNGNLVKEESEGGEYTGIYTYDDKKSPFFHCKTPKWALWLEFDYRGENNMKTWDETWDDGYDTGTYEYIYNDEGFPVSRTLVGEGTEETYTYKKK